MTIWLGSLQIIFVGFADKDFNGIGGDMKRHAGLWDRLAEQFDKPPYNGRWPDTKRAFAKLSEAYSRPWWKRMFIKKEETRNFWV
jgi:hypothetical protein